MHSILDPIYLLSTFGYIGLAFILFAETGLLIGFFLPGDSLLFAAGLVAAQGHLNVFLVMIIAALAAIAGDSFGYYFGKSTGHKLFARKDSRFFSQAYVTKAHVFFEKYGAWSVVLARFVPIIRTFTPIIAGASSMTYMTFLRYNVIGALIWTIGVTFLGVQLGRSIPNIDAYILPIVSVVIASSLGLSVFHYIKQKSTK
jgi:membrane-associated protein